MLKVRLFKLELRAKGYFIIFTEVSLRIVHRKFMCGIVAVFNTKVDCLKLRSPVLSMSEKVRHRGPDWSGIYSSENAILAHERLAIVDLASGGQPLSNEDKTLVLAVNGEIYNHQEIREECQSNYIFQTQSDCEVLLALYQERGIDFLKKLNGIFAFVLFAFVLI